MNTKQFLDKVIAHDGDVWRVIGVGVMRDGEFFCHLASTTRGRQQKNGWYPLQSGYWVPAEVLSAAS